MVSAPHSRQTRSMNDTETPQSPKGDTHEPCPGQSNPPSALDRFFAWVRGLGIVRGEDRWFAGVASGIATRANIDPLIVRGMFVVLAVLGGPGLLLYLAAWLLLPDRSGRIHFEDVVRGQATTGIVVALVVLCILPFIPLMFGWVPGFFSLPFWDAWGFMPDWLVLTLGILWWAVVVPGLIIWFVVWVAGGGLSRGAARNTAGQSPAAPSATPSSSTTNENDWGERFSQKADAWGENVETKTTEWAQKIEEKSRNWSDWAEEHHRTHRLGAVHMLITLAVALLAAGAAAAWALSVPFDRGGVITAGLIAAVAVLGVSVIVAGVRGRMTGWIGFLAFLGVLALIIAPVSTVMPDRTAVVPFGNTTISADDSAAEGLVVFAGNATVDLSSLEGRSDGKDIEVWTGFGNVTVLLPDNHPTRVSVDMLAGNVRDQRPGDELRQGGLLMSRVFDSGVTSENADQATEVRVRLLGGNIYLEGGDVAGTASNTADRAQNQLRAEQHARQTEINELRERLEELENRR